MPSLGEPKVLALLCDFADQRAEDIFPGMTRERVQANLFGQGTAEAQAFAPWESLHNFYARASNDRLLIDGSVLGWYHFAKAQTDYQPLISGDNKEGNWELIKEVLLAYDAEVDFSEFDNDGDGVVDSVNFLWVGEKGPWSSFWWGYRWTLRGSEADDFTLDDVRFEDFSWQWVESREEDLSDYDPRVITHEFGHLLGLPDLYDYYPGIGPEGGTGSFDVMDSSRGANHNAFSRWILGWIDPIFATAEDTGSYTLNAAGLPGSTENAVVIFLPDNEGNLDATDGSDPFREMLVVEHRSPIGNDDWPDLGEENGGLAIWHLSAALAEEGNTFANNNSNSPHKLIRLVQADDREDIETSKADFTLEDLYQVDQHLGPSSPAGNGSYDLAPSRIQITPTRIGRDSADFQLIPFTGPLLQVIDPWKELRQPPGAAYPPMPLKVIWSEGSAATEVTLAGESFIAPVSEAFPLREGENELNVTLSTKSLTLGITRGHLRFSSPNQTFPEVVIPIQLRVRIMLEEATGRYETINMSSGYPSPWIGQESVFASAPFAAESGPVADDRRSVLTDWVWTPVTVTFRWKVSSEADHDFLQLFVDGELDREISGEVDWQEVTLDLSDRSGWVSLDWAYQKDEANAEGFDRGWIDDYTVQMHYNSRIVSDFQSWGHYLDPFDLAADGRPYIEHYAYFGNRFGLIEPLPPEVIEGPSPTEPFLKLNWGNYSERDPVIVFLQGSNDGELWFTLQDGDAGLTRHLPDPGDNPIEDDFTLASEVPPRDLSLGEDDFYYKVPLPAPFRFFRRIYFVRY